jgi:2-amino-4-hydroxy-6-hydroxymethyldihydropteridine diphosphokinase
VNAAPAGGLPCREVVLALGSNVGDRVAHLQGAIDALCGGAGSGAALCCRGVSAVFETEPVGGPEQDDYLNAVLLAESRLPAAAILACCQRAEDEAGRVRTVRWGPRTLDVDVIAIGTDVSTDEGLTLPHPRAHERAFVLAPWLDVQPDAVLPGHGRVAGLLAAVPTTGMVRRPDLRLVIGRRAREEQPCS